MHRPTCVNTTLRPYKKRVTEGEDSVNPCRSCLAIGVGENGVGKERFQGTAGTGPVKKEVSSMGGTVVAGANF